MGRVADGNHRIMDFDQPRAIMDQTITVIFKLARVSLLGHRIPSIVGFSLRHPSQSLPTETSEITRCHL